MGKTYYVDTDLTMSVQQWIDAECEEDAVKFALEKAQSNSHELTRHGLFVKAVITDIIEENK